MHLYLHLYLYLYLYPSTAASDNQEHYRRHQHNYCSYHFARSAQAQEVSTIPSPPGAEKCHQEKAAQSSIAVVALPLSLHEPWRKRPVRNEARICRLALDAMQSTRHFGQYWELCPGDQNGPAARRYFLSGSFAFLRGRLRNTTARKCIRHGFLLKGKPKGTYAA